MSRQSTSFTQHHAHIISVTTRTRHSHSKELQELTRVKLHIELEDVVDGDGGKIGFRNAWVESVFRRESREYFRFGSLNLAVARPTSTRDMADAKAPKSLRLKFKGETSKKKRKHDNYDDAEGTSSSRRRRHDAQDDGSPEWVHPDQATEIRGPTFIFHLSDPLPICISFDATRNRIALHPLEKIEDGGSVLERTPSEVSQVWVTTRVAGASTVNLRTGTGEGKFLSCDKHGLVTADREARGPQEEWTPVVLEDGMVAFMNVYEKYLSIDEVAGGQLALRGDSDIVGFQERFYVKIQSKYKQEAHEEERKKGGELDLPSIDEKGAKWVSRLHILPSLSHPALQCDIPSMGRRKVRCIERR